MQGPPAIDPVSAMRQTRGANIGSMLGPGIGMSGTAAATSSDGELSGQDFASILAGGLAGAALGRVGGRSIARALDSRTLASTPKIRSMMGIGSGGIARATRAGLQYRASRGLDASTQIDYTKVVADKVRAARIADAYDALPKVDPKAYPAYQQFAREIEDQYEYLTKELGVKVKFVNKDPYKNSAEMMADVEKNNTLKVFKTSSTESHPFLSNEQNDKFRAIHDYFGHGSTGRGFAQDGEEAAWIAHSRMFSRPARAAMTTETRGQNSWYNTRGKKFAEQKVALLPEEFWDVPEDELVRLTLPARSSIVSKLINPREPIIGQASGTVLGALGGGTGSAAMLGEDGELSRTDLLGVLGGAALGAAAGRSFGARSASGRSRGMVELPFGMRAKPTKQIASAVGPKGEVGKEFVTRQGNFLGSLFAPGGVPIAPANALSVLRAAETRAAQTGETLQDALAAVPNQGLTAPEMEILSSLRSSEFLTDPNAPTTGLRLFQNPANPTAKSAARAAAVTEASIVRNYKGQDWLTNPSAKELAKGEGVMFRQYPAAEYSKIGPGTLPKYVKGTGQRGHFGLILDDLSEFEGASRTHIPIASLKDPVKRATLKSRAVENLVRVAMSSEGRNRIAGLYWYPRAGEVARQYDNPKQMADLMASLSPSLEWAANLDAAVGMKTLYDARLLDDIIASVKKYDEVAEAMTPKQRTEALDLIGAAVRERLAMLPNTHPMITNMVGNNARKALLILDDPARGDDILGELKTRQFSGNIMDQAKNNSSTIDIHASDAMLGAKFPGKDRGMSSQQRYDFGMEVMREAADILGMPPAALQAIDWVTWRAFFNPIK